MFRFVSRDYTVQKHTVHKQTRDLIEIVLGNFLFYKGHVIKYV
jgi:hypothetical protein